MSDDEKKNLPAKTPREYTPVQSDNPLLDTHTFEQMQRAASALMHSTLLPDSVRGDNPSATFSNLMFVADQAWRWNMPLLAVAQCVGIVNGKLVYEGKLISAVLSAKGIDLDFEHHGEWKDGDSFSITVSGEVNGRTRTIEGSVGDWKTFQKDGQLMPQWRDRAAHNQLAYRGAREWCRLWKPGVILGVYADDEIEEMREIRGSRRAAQKEPVQIGSGFATDDAQEAETVEKPKSTEKPAESDSEAEPPETPDDPPEAAEPAETKPSDEKTAKREPEMEEMARDMNILLDFPTLLEFVANALPAYEEWEDMKRGLAELSKTDDWKKAAETPG